MCRIYDFYARLSSLIDDVNCLTEACVAVFEQAESHVVTERWAEDSGGQITGGELWELSKRVIQQMRASGEGIRSVETSQADELKSILAKILRQSERAPAYEIARLSRKSS